MHPRALYFKSYNRSIFWLSQRFISNIYGKSYFATHPKDYEANVQDSLNGFLIKKPKKKVDEDLSKDADHRARMYVTAPWQKKYYLQGWEPEDSQFTQGDWCGGPFFSLLPARSYFRIYFPYVNNLHERCGLNIAVADDDPSCFFISRMEKNDGNKNVHLLYSHHHNDSIDEQYKPVSLKTLEETKKEFFHLKCKLLEKDLENLFVFQGQKICINAPLLQNFNKSARFEFFALTDAPWLPRPERPKTNEAKPLPPEPTRTEVVWHYTKSIAKSAAVGAGIGFSAGFLLGLATFGTGWIACVVVGTILGIIDGIDYAKNNPVRPSFFPEKKTMSSTPPVGFVQPLMP